MSSATRAWRLLVRILFEPGDERSNVALTEALPRSADFWAHAVSIANQHLITATFWERLSRRELASRVDPDALEYLQSFSAVYRDKLAEVHDQAIECITALNAAGIEPMPIKGAAVLLDPAHPLAAHRFMTDIDVLVPLAQLEESRCALAELGYAPIPDPDGEYDEHHHIAPLVREGNPTTIEIHHAAVPRSLEAVLPNDELWARSAVRERHGARYRVPHPTDTMMIHFVHEALVDRCLALFLIPLKTFIDIDVLADRAGHDIDWELLTRQARRVDAEAAWRRFCDHFTRLTGRPLLNQHARLSDAAHFAVSKVIATRPALALVAWRLDRLSSDYLRQKHGETDTAALHRRRLAEIRNMLARGAKWRGDQSEST